MKSFPIIWETEYWKVILHEDQQYLGRAIVSAKHRERPTLSSLTKEELVDFHENVVKVFESAIQRAFGAELFNWSCLMNLAYKNNPPDPHVHWHVKPRYRQSVSFAGLQFTDDAFGTHYSTTVRVVNDEVLQAIAAHIRAHQG